MSTVTDYYRIARPVPFVNVHVDCDNLKFVDPHRIRLQIATGDPYATDAIAHIDTFMEHLVTAIGSSNHRLKAMGLENLKRFEEPRETRLGMSRRGFNGHGGADETGERIWATLNDPDRLALIELGVLGRLEQLPLFVEGVSNDVTSDITTRLIFSTLAGFTNDVVEAFPEFSRGRHCLESCTRQVWSPASIQWEHRKVRLPVADGAPLLLVPAGWVGDRILMRAERYYETAVLSYAQERDAVVTWDGRVLLTSKRTLSRKPGLTRGRDTNMRVTLAALESDDRNLAREFETFVDMKAA